MDENEDAVKDEAEEVLEGVAVRCTVEGKELSLFELEAETLSERFEVAEDNRGVLVEGGPLCNDFGLGNGG